MNRSVRFLPALFAWTISVELPCASTPSDDLLLHLPLNEDLRDHSSFRRETQIEGEISILNGAAYFSGEKTALGIEGITLANQPFTVAMWIQQTGREQMYGLVEQHHSGRRGQWLHLMTRGARQPYLGFYRNDSMSPASILPNRWVHLIFSYDDENQMIWIDGRPACARKASSYRGASGTLWIGRTPRWTNVPSHDFEGFIKDFRVYSRVLTWSEIGELSGRPLRQVAGVNRSKVPDPQDMPLSPSRARDGGVPFLYVDGNRLCITGESAQIYEIQSAPALIGPWKPLGSVTNTHGSLEMNDPFVSPKRQRFYRIQVTGAK